MKILLDTRIAIWAVMDSDELPDEARRLLLDEDNEIYNRHSEELGTLVRPKDTPPHKDPFDRLLLAQAKSEGMKFMTHDSLIPYYNEPNETGKTKNDKAFHGLCGMPCHFCAKNERRIL